MGNPNRTVSMIECLLARGQNNFLRRRKRFEFPHSLGHLRGRSKNEGILEMTGSISLYDRHGERLHTIYVGAAPEYGKEAFFDRMTREIVHVKSLHPKAHFVGIADGARSNWDFLGPHIDEQVLDFYHASHLLEVRCLGDFQKRRRA
jgi:hypothetical protein